MTEPEATSLPVSSEAGTYPPVELPTAEPKYTLDMDAVHSDMNWIKSKANEVSINKTLWIVKLFDNIMNQTGLLSLFLFVFFMSVLGVLLWK